ncbi:hypothetical protein SCHPADRAFT_895283 [Schizopora paradoxa]|uniref:Uncharacterized protein n=1 Tax=Schizopora paradoxa TaxID=27342 RepID=A0A0H2R459_9AGAM|nr:hypothetical protein SCHPADRAFT_895283 [Schizopora paradoxa]
MPERRLIIELVRVSVEKTPKPPVRCILKWLEIFVKTGTTRLRFWLKLAIDEKACKILSKSRRRHFERFEQIRISPDWAKRLESMSTQSCAGRMKFGRGSGLNVQNKVQNLSSRKTHWEKSDGRGKQHLSTLPTSDSGARPPGSSASSIYIQAKNFSTSQHGYGVGDVAIRDGSLCSPKIWQMRIPGCVTLEYCSGRTHPIIPWFHEKCGLKTKEMKGTHSMHEQSGNARATNRLPGNLRIAAKPPPMVGSTCTDARVKRLQPWSFSSNDPIAHCVR